MVKKEKGIVLVVVIIVILILVITAMALLTLAEQQPILGRIETDKNKAFYLAEAGLAKMAEKLQKPIVGNLSEVLEGTLGGGSYRVEIDTNYSPCYVISTGISGNIQKKVRVQATFLAPLYEYACFAMNRTGTPYSFQLRGTGNPVVGSSGDKGGKDILNGNIFVDGSAFLYDSSCVNAAPAPNKWLLNGDVEATGSVSRASGATVAGTISSNVEEPTSFSLNDMDYANNNTYNVSQVFTAAGVSSGFLPVGNALRDVFVKNPSDRTAECASTTSNDFFFEPSSGFIGGSWNTAPTPLHAGSNRIYYIDGDLWVHSKNGTYGFNMDGKVTIVVTGNIHICDNLQYADTGSILGLIALGKYDGTGNLISGGNIYFGDPDYGTLYTFSAMMFASNNFLYNTAAIGTKDAEPKSGFIVNGSFAAMNQVSINRDWYTSSSYYPSTDKPAIYDTATGKWLDAKTKTALTSTEISTLRHYRMVVNYDDRVRNPETRPSGLPKGGTKIFAGFSNWEEL